MIAEQHVLSLLQQSQLQLSQSAPQQGRGNWTKDQICDEIAAELSAEKPYALSLEVLQRRLNSKGIYRSDTTIRGYLRELEQKAVVKAHYAGHNKVSYYKT